jgi:hypothetical protein
LAAFQRVRKNIETFNDCTAGRVNQDRSSFYGGNTRPIDEPACVFIQWHVE